LPVSSSRLHCHWERPDSEVPVRAATPSATFGSSVIRSLLKISPWCPEVSGLISSGMAANGAIRLIDLRDKTTTAIFPTATPKERWDKKTYPACPGPIDPAEQTVAVALT